MDEGMGWLNDEVDAVVVAVAQPVEGHYSDFDAGAP